ncbi:hypothetical protein ACLOJK_019002 [Asimina triloba]
MGATGGDGSAVLMLMPPGSCRRRCSPAHCRSPVLMKRRCWMMDVVEKRKLYSLPSACSDRLGASCDAEEGRTAWLPSVVGGWFHGGSLGKMEHHNMMLR